MARRPSMNQYHAMASFMSPPPNYHQQGWNGGPFHPPPGPPPPPPSRNAHSTSFNLTVQPPTPSTYQESNSNRTFNFAVQPPIDIDPALTQHERPPQQQPSPSSRRVFPTSFTLYHKTSASSLIDPDSLTFTLGTNPQDPLYAAQLSTDTFQRPKLTLVPAWDKTMPPLGSIKTKGWKDSIITVEPPAGSSRPGELPLVEKLTLKMGMSHRTYSFACPIAGHSQGIGKRETFAWKRAGSSSSSSSSSSTKRQQSKFDKWGVGLGDYESDDGDDDDGDLGLQTKRELIREATNEVVAVWTENDGSSMTKTGTFEFVNSGASMFDGGFGPQWEIMAVISCLRIWHEDYHVAKAVLEAVGGA